MEKEKVNQVVMAYKNDLPQEKVFMLRSLLERAPDTAYESVLCVNTKKTLITVLLSVFLGCLGIDRFYIGDVGKGVAKLLFGWLTFGIWPLIDIFCCYKKAKEQNFDHIAEVLAAA